MQHYGNSSEKREKTQKNTLFYWRYVIQSINMAYLICMLYAISVIVELLILTPRIWQTKQIRYLFMLILLILWGRILL